MTENNLRPTKKERFRGIILGTAVGDSIGLPAEGLSRRRIRKFFKGRWRHRLFFNRGMVSDDTDHTAFIALCLLAHSDSLDHFTRKLAWCLRLWILTLPAGIGFATLRSIIRLWFGISPQKSGVYSAGNGPAMRVAPIGAFFANNPKQINEFVYASTKITHTDSKALIGAKAVAHLVAWCVRDELTTRPPLKDLMQMLSSIAQDESEWLEIVETISTSHQNLLSVEEFADSLNLHRGVTGYIYHSVPVAIYSWYRNFGNFEKILTEVLNCGGDTDTVGAIAGALAGAVVGEKGIPKEWIDGIFDLLRGVPALCAIADKLAMKSENEIAFEPMRFLFLGGLLRNLVLICLVVAHVLRRLLPPY